MKEDDKHQQVCSPAVNRSYQPSKMNFSHDVLNAFKRFLGSGLVVKQQQDTRDKLSDKEKQCHSTEVIPDRMPVNGDCFLGNHTLDLMKV